MPAKRSIQLLGETIHRDNVQRIVIEDPTADISLTIRLQNGTVLRVAGPEATAAIQSLFAPDFGLIMP